MRSLKRSDSDHKREIKEIREWIEALSIENCELSFLRLSNLLGLFKPKEFLISDNDISTAEERSKLKMIIKELAKRTEHLDQVFYAAEPKYLLPKESDIIESLKEFKTIEKFRFDTMRVGFKMLELVATLPIQRLCTFSDSVEQDVIRFIRENNTIEHLEIRQHIIHMLPSTLIDALLVNRTLKVCLLFYKASFYQ